MAVSPNTPRAFLTPTQRTVMASIETRIDGYIQNEWNRNADPSIQFCIGPSTETTQAIAAELLIKYREAKWPYQSIYIDANGCWLGLSMNPIEATTQWRGVAWSGVS